MNDASNVSGDLYKVGVYHTPVLFHEILEELNIKTGQWYVDGTIGGGGYTSGILSMGGNVLGIDIDSDAIVETRRRLTIERQNKKEGTDYLLIQDNFRNIERIAKSQNIIPQGIVLDLGVSSHQINTKERGMSFRFPDAPLDFRLSQNHGERLSSILLQLSKEDLYEIFSRYGEEEHSRTISDAVYRACRVKELSTVGDLIQAISTGLGRRADDRTLARIFQALRIYTNDELGALKEALDAGEKILSPEGRMAVISFHSLEDRIVKQFFRRNGWNTKGPIVAGEEEQRENRRSRSAKMRIGIKKI